MRRTSHDIYKLTQAREMQAKNKPKTRDNRLYTTFKEDTALLIKLSVVFTIGLGVAIHIFS